MNLTTYNNSGKTGEVKFNGVFVRTYAINSFTTFAFSTPVSR